jgi:hypothetical protein
MLEQSPVERAVKRVFPTTRAAAEDLADVAEHALRQAVRQVLVDRAVTDPATSSGQGAARNQLTVVADKGEINGRARFYVPLASRVDAQITLTGPLASGQTTFATAEGLGQNVSLNTSVKYMIWSRVLKPEKVTAAALAMVRGAFVTRAPAGLDQLPPERQGLATLEMIRRAAASGENPRVLADGLTDAGDTRLARLVVSPSLVSTPERFYAAVVQEQPELVETRWAAYLTPGFDLTRYAVKYVDAEAAASSTFQDSTSMFTASAGVSHIAQWKKKEKDKETEKEKEVKFLTPLFYAGLTFRKGESVRVADKQNVCLPLGAAGALECIDAPVGAPVPSTLTSVSAEYRHWAFNQSLGINPKYTYARQRATGQSSTQVVWAFEVPVYFMHQVKDINIPDITFGADLTGGLSVGWRDAGSRAGPFITLFLTKIFNIP